MTSGIHAVDAGVNADVTDDIDHDLGRQDARFDISADVVPSDAHESGDTSDWSGAVG